jgi:hypothetical protein
MALLREEEDVKPGKDDPIARKKHCIKKRGSKPNNNKSAENFLGLQN